MVCIPLSAALTMQKREFVEERNDTKLTPGGEIWAASMVNGFRSSQPVAGPSIRSFREVWPSDQWASYELDDHFFFPFFIHSLLDQNPRCSTGVQLSASHNWIKSGSNMQKLLYLHDTWLHCLDTYLIKLLVEPERELLFNIPVLTYGAI